MSLSWKWYVYVIEGHDGSYYSGITWRTQLRLEEQAIGLGRNYIQQHGIRRLAYVEEHLSLKEARLREKNLRKLINKKEVANVPDLLGV